MALHPVFAGGDPVRNQVALLDVPRGLVRQLETSAPRCPGPPSKKRRHCYRARQPCCAGRHDPCTVEYGSSGCSRSTGLAGRFQCSVTRTRCGRGSRRVRRWPRILLARPERTWRGYRHAPGTPPGRASARTFRRVLLPSNGPSSDQYGSVRGIHSSRHSPLSISSPTSSRSLAFPGSMLPHDRSVAAFRKAHRVAGAHRRFCPADRSCRVPGLGDRGTRSRAHDVREIGRRLQRRLSLGGFGFVVVLSVAPASVYSTAVSLREAPREPVHRAFELRHPFPECGHPLPTVSHVIVESPDPNVHPEEAASDADADSDNRPELRCH